MPDCRQNVAVLHVALNPHTGAWSVMRELAHAQARSGLYAGVGLGIIHDVAWPEAYRAELRELNLPTYTAPTPRMFGTASFLWQVLRRPGIEDWVRDLRGCTGAKRVIVHVHNAWMTGVFLPLKDTRPPETLCVATFHGVNAQLEGKPVRHLAHRWMAQRLLHAGALLTSVDAANLELARALFGLPPGRFTVIPNGVPADTPTGCPFAHNATTFTVGHVGAITARKGWRLAAEAAVLAAQTGAPVRCLIAGMGEEAPDAAAFAHRHPDVVTFLGHVPNPRLRLMPKLDLLAVMSAHEGLPMTILEAQSAGVPAAATAVGGIPQAVRPGISGHLVPRNAKALADVILALCASPAKLADLHLRTRESFLATFAIDLVLRQYDVLYRSYPPGADA